MKTLDPFFVQKQVNELLLTNPELDHDEVLRHDMFQAETDVFEFLSQVSRKIGATRTLIDATDHYVNELKERRTRFERREYSLRKLIFDVMQTADLRKAELPECTISIRAGQPRVVIIDEKQIPPEFLRVKTEPDKLRIKAALQAHENVAGACLSNSEPTLSIHVK